METGKAPNLKGTIAAFVDKITVSDSNITIRYRFEPTLSRIDKFDLYGALGRALPKITPLIFDITYTREQLAG